MSRRLTALVACLGLAALAGGVWACLRSSQHRGPDVGMKQNNSHAAVKDLPERRPAAGREREPGDDVGKSSVVEKRLGRLRMTSDREEQQLLSDQSSGSAEARDLAWQVAILGLRDSESPRTRIRACLLITRLQKVVAGESGQLPPIDQRVIAPLAKCLEAEDHEVVHTALVVLLGCDEAHLASGVRELIVPHLERLMASPKKELVLAGIDGVSYFSDAHLALELAVAWAGLGAGDENFSMQCHKRLRRVLETHEYRRILASGDGTARAEAFGKAQAAAEALDSQMGDDPDRWVAYWRSVASAGARGQVQNR